MPEFIDLRGTDWTSLLPNPHPAGHKYGRGHCLVISGPVQKAGAAALAASNALRVGAGLVTVVAPENTMALHVILNPSVMVEPFGSASDFATLLATSHFDSCIAGPGLPPTDETRNIIAAMCQTNANLILDAGAISAFETAKDDFANLITPRTPQTVLTPHDGEYARVFGSAPLGVRDRAAHLSTQAENSKSHIVLKGRRSLYARPNGAISILPKGSKWLATAGTGDVFTGLIGGLLAQNIGAQTAIPLASWLHAQASFKLGRFLTSSDMQTAIWDILRGT